MTDPPSGPPTSVDAILAATRRVIAERGPERFTMSAIAAAAGVSRPTLYRWFPTKDALLTALTVYEEEQFDARLAAGVAAERSPTRRLDAALRLLVTYLDGSPRGATRRGERGARALSEPQPRTGARDRAASPRLDLGPDPIGADPGFAIASLAASLAPQTASFARVLGDALDTVPAVARGHLSREQAAEMFLRIAYSHYLVPHPDPQVLLANLRAFAGLPRRSIRRAAG